MPETFDEVMKTSKLKGIFVILNEEILIVLYVILAMHEQIYITFVEGDVFFCLRSLKGPVHMWVCGYFIVTCVWTCHTCEQYFSSPVTWILY